MIAYLAFLHGEGLAANSVNRALAAIRGFYRYLLREKKVDHTPWPISYWPRFGPDFPTF